VAEDRTPDVARDRNDLARRREAEQYRTLGQERHAAGDVEDAAAYYRMSVDVYPTAEAYTYLGVALAARGQWSDAIVQCERAIRIDPELGNAYNDLAVYTAELGRLHEALHWLDKAIAAKKYDCRNYPFYHRGRILERLRRFTEARDAYMTSLEIEPDWEPARVALRRVLGWLN